MDVHRQQCAGSCRPHVGNGSARHRIYAVLGLLTFAVQLVAPVVHMWEVAAQRTAVTFAALSLPFPSGQGACPTARSVTNERPQRVLHNAALCPVCQILTRIRDCIVAQVEGARHLTVVSWLVPFPWLPLPKFSRSAIAARAPPSPS